MSAQPSTDLVGVRHRDSVVSGEQIHIRRDGHHAVIVEVSGGVREYEVRGRGLLAGVEFVEDAETRAPFPRSLHFAESFTQAALDAGVVVWPNVGQADGVNGDLVMLAPPFVITEAEIADIVARLRIAYDATVGSTMSHRS